MRLAAFICAAFWVGCGGAQRVREPNEAIEDPSLLVSTTDISSHFVVQQRVRAKFRSREMVFQATMQNTARGLVLVAFTPQGQKAFVLTQLGRVVAHENHLRKRLPFSPWQILLAIHRTYFRGSQKALPDGKHVVEDTNDLVQETWQGGQLRERTYEKKGARGRAIVTIRYHGVGSELFERPVTYHDKSHGFTLDVTPVRFSDLSNSAKDE